jgi:hypothetical protein
MIDNPYSLIFLNWTPIVKWYVVSCCSKDKFEKRHMFKRDWSTCSKHDNYPRRNTQHDWGDVYGHLMSTKIFTFIMNKIFK